ncbi:acyl-CoA dehydrogenase family protein [Streptomyces sp. NPDC059904]|uniref:acyl-CoA dehydrogenase family protein n=1 Tax=Streptomyces sp. NPDC059904 TaxID=3346996 RepID=UPI00365DC05F
MDAADFKAVRDAVRRLVREDAVPREDEIEETDAIPEDVRREAADMGLFGYTLPEEHGGLGATLSEDVQLAFEFGHTTPSFRSMFGTNNGLAGKVLVNAGTEEQQRHWLPRLAEGAVASFALTEAEAGSDRQEPRQGVRRGNLRAATTSDGHSPTPPRCVGALPVFGPSSHSDRQRAAQPLPLPRSAAVT